MELPLYHKCVNVASGSLSNVHFGTLSYVKRSSKILKKLGFERIGKAEQEGEDDNCVILVIIVVRFHY